MTYFFMINWIIQMSVFFNLHLDFFFFFFFINVRIQTTHSVFILCLINSYINFGHSNTSPLRFYCTQHSKHCNVGINVGIYVSWLEKRLYKVGKNVISQLTLISTFFQPTNLNTYIAIFLMGDIYN